MSFKPVIEGNSSSAYEIREELKKFGERCYNFP